MILKFKEWLAEQLIQTELFEMAETRAHAEKIVRGLGKEVIFHLIKVLYWKDEVNYNKHIKDINTWLNDIAHITLKPNDKNPKAKDIYEWMWAAPFPMTFEVFETKTINGGKLRDYHSLPRTNITVEELYNKLTDISKKLSEDINKDKFTKIEGYL